MRGEALRVGGLRKACRSVDALAELEAGRVDSRSTRVIRRLATTSSQCIEVGIAVPMKNQRSRSCYMTIFRSRSVF